jgi:O-antigen/teichoic acid export membrane protein
MVAFPMAFGIAALAGPIVALLTGARASEFADSVLVLQILCAVVPLFYLNGVAQEFLYSSHRDWYVVAAYGLAAAVSLLGNLLLIPVLGVHAVAWVAAISNLAVSVMFVYGMRKQYGAMGLPSLAAKTIIACCIMAGAAHAISGISLVASIAFGAILYVALQAVLRTLTPEESTLIVSMLAALLPGRRKRAT